MCHWSKGYLVGWLGINFETPHVFSPAEIELAQEVGERTWAALERARAEQALRESEEKYRSLFDAMVEGFSVVEIVRDDAGRAVDIKYIELNPAFEQQTGLLREEVVGRTLSEIYTSGDVGRWLNPIAAVADTGRPIVLEEYSERVHRWFESSMYDRGGDRVAVFYHDVTARKQVEQKEHETKKNQDFLLRLSDALRAETAADAVAQRAIDLLLEHLRVDRCFIAYYRLEEDELDFRYQTGRKGVLLLPETVRLSDFPDAFETVRESTIVINDDLEREGVSSAERDNTMALGMRARLGSTVRLGPKRPVASLVAECAEPRYWTDAEIALVEDAAERIWAAIEQARAQEALFASEERLRQFGEASQDVLWIRDCEHLQWQYLTPAFETIYGLKREEALSGNNYRSWIELIHPEDRTLASENIRRVRNGEHVTFEYRVKRPRDGAIRWLRNTDFPITNAGGEVILIGGIGEDITAEKLVQEELKASEERLRNATEVGKLGLWDWDMRSNTVHWSDQHFRLEGYEVGEVVPSYETWIARVHPDDREGAEAALSRARDAHEEFNHEFRTVHPDRSVHWLLGRGQFFYDETGAPIRMVGAMLDVTLQRNWQERQNILVAELQHRTRNLITVVRSIANETLSTSSSLEDFKHAFGDRMGRLSAVQGLLSRSESEPITIGKLVELELDALGAQSGERVVVSGPPIVLRNSTVQTIALALHELATNALKYGALSIEGGRLSVTWRELQKDGARWLDFLWEEYGISPEPRALSATPNGGYGRRLIEHALPYSLAADVEYELGSDALRCAVKMPLDQD
ncbi:PAS domain-containing protein [Devosia aurantiaca]|uniref:Blue-light-activated histidine kinase n=1 Tax=Devosia aurantiaca TaxID=2714858 RepID=A0A6M1SQ01_9HYPH|nr:PAS domain-containing protein [Devosia aurantiaca]NGP17285.1 PAS domain-containing protein [Devosia aurantiaca]